MKRTSTLLVALFSAFSGMAQIPTSGLLCHMKFNNSLNEEVSSANAIVGGNPGGISFATDRFGNPNSAVSLSNSPHGYLDLGDLNLVNPDYTISFWMSYNSFSSGQRKILSKREACSNGSFIDLTLGTSTGPELILESNAQNNTAPNLSYTFVPANFWVHVVLVLDATAKKTYFYLDGSLTHTVNWGATLNNGSMDNIASFMLGYSPCINGSSVLGYSGLLDDLRVYNFSLSSFEVTDLYNEANDALDVSEISTQNIVSVYPNPANISLNVALNEVEMIRIFDILGSEMLVSPAQKNHQINVSGLPAGVYFVRTSSGRSVKFIKE